ncbi:MAG TPA: NAD(P)/FAD-dependent oxidoreductase [Quisquiliibacterium sp.]|nr:NAD(P)/FAD-dependent oxidoreductase [Quisquiliibacterium sp.]
MNRPARGAGGAAAPVFDVAVLGAGAAGMFCAGVAGQRGASVVLIDHAAQPGEKIRISGGGRCNFTNVDAGRLERYASAEPRFARHALRAYPPARFIELVDRHRIPHHEKHRGQLFCDDSSLRIVRMLREEADAGGVHWRLGCGVHGVRTAGGGQAGFLVDCEAGTIAARALVVATGGLSIPKIGATDVGYRIARQFGLKIVETRPALVPLTFDAAAWTPFGALSGVALEVDIAAPAEPDAPRFREDLLFTHRGLSGPAVLQISSFWRPGAPLEIDLAPGRRLEQEWIDARPEARQQLSTLLAAALPRRLGALWLEHFSASHPGVRPETRIAEVGNRALRELAGSLQRWALHPSGTEGYRKAEVTAGGVATAGLDARTMQARAVPGLYFVGEVVDVTGWLGGYNFQWAWSSAYAAAMALTA